MKRTMTIKNVEGIDHHTSWLEQKKQDVYLCILCVMRYMRGVRVRTKVPRLFPGAISLALGSWQRSISFPHCWTRQARIRQGYIYYLLHLYILVPLKLTMRYLNFSSNLVSCTLLPNDSHAWKRDCGGR